MTDQPVSSSSSLSSSSCSSVDSSLHVFSDDLSAPLTTELLLPPPTATAQLPIPPTPPTQPSSDLMNYTPIETVLKEFCHPSDALPNSVTDVVVSCSPKPDPQLHSVPRPLKKKRDRIPSSSIHQNNETQHKYNPNIYKTKRFAHQVGTNDMDTTTCTPDWIYDIKYMTFAGGGTKGYVYAGVILMLDDAFRQKGINLYEQIKGYSGTSVGAFYALLMTLGVRGWFLIREILQTDVSHVFKEMRIDNLMEMHGLNSSSKFKNQIRNVLESFIGEGEITFRKLYSITKKHFVCCVTNITEGKAEYHSYLSTPDYKVCDSVAASMSIPFLFAPSIINGHFYVDGGLVDNVPHCVFPPDEILILSLSGILHNMNTLQGYALRLATIGMITMDESRIQNLSVEHQRRRVILKVNDDSALNFNISTAQKKEMLLSGAKQMCHFLHPNIMVEDYAKMVTKILVCNIICNNSRVKNKEQVETKSNENS